MHKIILKLFLLLSLCIYGLDSSAQLSNSIKLYKLQSYGDERACVRILSDYRSVKTGDEFYVMLYFGVTSPWYVYSEKESDSHLPLSVTLKLPDGIKILDKKSDKGLIKDGNEIYENDFCIIFHLQSVSALKEDFEITADIHWQCCDGNLCTMCDVKPCLVMQQGKTSKSSLYKEIHKMTDHF